MKTYTPDEIKAILDKHYKWLRDEPDGKRADLSYADLSYADLSSADLSYANLSYADLSAADLRSANLSAAYNLDKAIGFMLPIACPEKGAFTAFKACRAGLIVELLIPAEAKRSSATGRKCRCDKAVVVEITDTAGNPVDTEAASQYDSGFKYRKGDTVIAETFDDNRWKECAPGIHFFITMQEAVDYGK